MKVRPNAICTPMRSDLDSAGGPVNRSGPRYVTRQHTKTSGVGRDSHRLQRQCRCLSCPAPVPDYTLIISGHSCS